MMNENSSIFPDSDHSDKEKKIRGFAEMEFDILVRKFVEKD